MTIRHIAAAAAVAASLGLGLANAQTSQTTPGAVAPGSVPGGTGTGIPGATSAQPNPTPGMSPAQGTQPPSAMNQGSTAPGGSASTGGAMTRDSGMAPGGAATGSTEVLVPGTRPGSAPGTTTGDARGGTGAATGATTPGTTTQGGGRADQTPPAVTTQHTEPRTAAAPVPGANSFTEGQARARMSDAGFNDVQGLRLDDQGIWRGRAMRGGQQTGVALDFQGNVVATQ